MTYRDIANLSRDTIFAARLGAGLASEASLKTSDYLVDAIMKDPAGGALMFMPFVSVAPGFADQFAVAGQDAIDDAEILSAIQACWPRVYDLYLEDENGD